MVCEHKYAFLTSGNDAKDIRRCPEADIVSSAQEKQPCPCNNSSKEVKDNLSG